MFFPVLVCLGSRIRIPPVPELFNKLFFFFWGGQGFKDGLLFRRDDINDVVIEPLAVEVLLLLPLVLLDTCVALCPASVVTLRNSSIAVIPII